MPTSTKGHRKGKGRYVFSEVDMDPSGARRACAIAGTAEYAETVTPQMVDYLCTLCEEERAGDVSLDGARDALEALASSAVSAVINGLLTQASRLIDGPLPSGPSEGISVMTASTHAWQLDEVRGHAPACLRLRFCLQLRPCVPAPVHLPVHVLLPAPVLLSAPAPRPVCACVRTHARCSARALPA